MARGEVDASVVVKRRRGSAAHGERGGGHLLPEVGKQVKRPSCGGRPVLDTVPRLITITQCPPACQGSERLSLTCTPLSLLDLELTTNEYLLAKHGSSVFILKEPTDRLGIII